MPSLRNSASSAPRTPLATAASAALTRRSFSDAENRRRFFGCTLSTDAPFTPGSLSKPSLDEISRSAFREGRLFAEPGSLVTFSPGDAHPFEIHGLEAGYAPLGVFANYRDVNNGGFGIPNATFQVQLSPKTILVPFYVVRALSRDAGTPFGQQINAQLGKSSIVSSHARSSYLVPL